MVGALVMVVLIQKFSRNQFVKLCSGKRILGISFSRLFTYQMMCFGW